MRREISAVVFAGLVLAFGLVMFSMGLTVSSTRQLWHSVAWVEHSDTVLLELEALLSLVKDAETGERGYLLTGKPDYLTPYAAAGAGLQTHLDTLEKLTVDNRAQRERLADVRQKAAVRMADLKTSIDTFQRHGFAAARARVMLDVGRDTMLAMRLSVRAMQAEETGLLARRRALAEATYRDALSGGLASGSAALAAILAFFLLLRRFVAARADELQRSESSLEVTLAGIGDGVITTDRDGKVLYLNAVAAELTGWPAAAAVGLALSDVFHVLDADAGQPVDNPAARALRDKCGAGPADGAILVAKNGAVAFIDEGTAPLRDRLGNVRGAVLIFRDVSERRRQIAELERRERQFHSLAESIPQLCWMANGDGHVFWYNRRWYEFTGTSFARMEGWGWQSVHDPLVLPRVVAGWQAALLAGVPFEMDFPLKGADGRFRQFLTRVVPMRDERGQVVRWIGTNTDVTTAREAAQALHDRERELQTIADNTPDMLSRFDRQLRHVFINRAAERFSGRPQAAFLGQTHRDLGLPDAPRMEAALRFVFSQGQARTIELRCEGPAGPLDLLVQFVPELGPDGEVEHVLGVSRDRTVEKAAQDALRATDRRKDEFLATLAHELRNPLGPLRTGLRVLRKTQDAAVTRRTHEAMERQLAHLIRLIDDLMDVSRLTSGKVILRRERVSLASVVEMALEATRAQVEASGHRLLIDVAEPTLWLDVDATRMCQVLAKLLANAVKYSPDGSRISLAAWREEGQVVIAVGDEGLGIPAHMLAQVFELFAQINNTLARAQGGLGVGLTLARRLVDMHGGSIVAASAGLDQGSTFTVRLPAVA